MLMSQFPSWMETSKARGAPSLWLHGASWYHYMAECAPASTCLCVCLCQWVCEKKTNVGGWGRGEIDNMMFTLGLSFWDCASIQACCDTHHTSNLVPFIITLYSQRPHLVCHYQRSLLFPSTYVWNPSETNMSHVDNSAILVNPIVYIILKTCNPERIPISDF